MSRISYADPPDVRWVKVLRAAADLRFRCWRRTGAMLNAIAPVRRHVVQQHGSGWVKDLWHRNLPDLKCHLRGVCSGFAVPE